MESKIIYGEPYTRQECKGTPPEEETKRNALENYLHEAMSDLCDTIRPSEVGNRIEGAQRCIAKIENLIDDVLAIEYERGYANGVKVTDYNARTREELAYTNGKEAGIDAANKQAEICAGCRKVEEATALANERILATSRMQYTAGREDGFAEAMNKLVVVGAYRD